MRLCALTFAFCAQSIVIQNLFLEKVCFVNFGLNASVCSSVNQNVESPVNDRIQKYVSTLNIYASLIESIPSIFCVLFLGPWSNRNGRKLIIILPFLGTLLSTLLYIANYLTPSWSAEYVLLGSVPWGVFGGGATLFMALIRFVDGNYKDLPAQLKLYVSLRQLHIRHNNA